MGDDDDILVVDSTLAPWFVFDSPASGSVVHICYKFNGERLLEPDIHKKHLWYVPAKRAYFVNQNTSFHWIDPRARRDTSRTTAINYYVVYCTKLLPETSRHTDSRVHSQ